MTTITDPQDAQAALARREGAARRYAHERALTLRKSRIRRPDHPAFGRFQLENLPDSGVTVDALNYLRDQLAGLGGYDQYLPAGSLEMGYPLTLDEVEMLLEAPTVYQDGCKFTRAPANMRCTYRRR